ncbi:MAG: LacI family DNA-binding transcriptional regulator [Micrococcales bacterium]|nr:LacI family DNA-binding transcriptional regulator [Micrococcales bacterium]
MGAVAAAAGVSKSTVSHVVNKTRPVAPETEHAVLQAMARLGYVGPGHTGSVPDAMTIGIAMSAMSNPYFGTVVQAMDRRASLEGYSLLLADTHDDPVHEVRAMTDLLRRGVSGVILAPSPDPTAALGYATQNGVPVVLIDRILPLGLDQVGSENADSTAALVEHLGTHGHRRICFVSPLPGLTTTEERLAGFRLGLARVGITDEFPVLTGADSTDLARQLARVLAEARPPTAVVSGNNHSTIELVKACRALGLSVPEDLALAVFDDFEWADSFHPRLTAVAQPTSAIGSQSVELLLSRLSSPDMPARTVRMQTAFVARESCGCPA